MYFLVVNCSTSTKSGPHTNLSAYHLGYYGQEKAQNNTSTEFSNKQNLRLDLVRSLGAVDLSNLWLCFCTFGSVSGGSTKFTHFNL